MTKVNTHGGARPGAGRKPGYTLVTPSHRRNRLMITLPQWIIDWLRAKAIEDGESMGHIVGRALIKEHGNDSLDSD